MLTGLPILLSPSPPEADLRPPKLVLSAVEWGRFVGFDAANQQLPITKQLALAAGLLAPVGDAGTGGFGWGVKKKRNLRAKHASA
jgi:hypothetical protein